MMLKRFTFLTLIFVTACASSPQTMRSKEPYYETNLNLSIASAIDCVSKGIDGIDPSIFEPVSQSVKYLPNASEGSIYLSAGKATNFAIVDFSGTKKTNVKLLYNTNVIAKTNKLTQVIENCK